MPAQTSKSTLFDRLGGSKRFGKIVADHAHDPIRSGMSDLPPNIKNGVARLTKLYIAQYASGDGIKGKDYLRGEAVIVEPKKTRDGERMVSVEGLTAILGPFPLCETKNQSEENNVSRALEEVKKLGITADELAEQAAMAGGFEGILEALVEAAPYVRFSTSPKFAQDDPKKEQEPTGSWTNWNGVLPDYEEGSSEDVQDDTQAEEPAPAPTKSNGKPVTAAKKATAPAKEPEPEPIIGEPEDLDTLAEIADKRGDADPQSEARTELKRLGLEAGLTEEWIDETANSWTQVAEKIKEGAGGAGDGDRPTEDDAPAADEPYEPSKLDLVMYKGKKDKKPQEYEVTKVYAKNQTVDLLSNVDKKTTYAGVKWSELAVS